MKIKINEDTDLVNLIRTQLKETHGYCPCVLPSVWSEDTKCICKNFQKAPANTYCHCGLYYKIEE